MQPHRPVAPGRDDDRRAPATLPGPAVWLALAALLAAPASADGQGDSAAASDASPTLRSGPDAAVLEGRVLEMGTGRPLAGAVVSLEGADLRARTSDDGGYVLPGVPSGEHRVAVRYLGRTSASRSVAVEPGGVYLATFRLETRPVRVPDLRVTVERAGPGGKLRGFRRRRARHPAGHFIGREEIEARDPHRLSDLLLGVPGLRLGRQAAGGAGPRRAASGRRSAIPGRPRCRIRYFVDGVHLPESTHFALDQLAPEDVVGIEIYRGTSEVPARFERDGDACGVIVVWTRDPGENRRRGG